MSVPKLSYSAGNAASTTTSASMTNSDTATPLTSTTNFSAAPTPGEGMLLLDEGASTEEIAYGTGLSGGSVTTPLANRGLEGGSAQAHAAGASVKGILTAGMWNNMITALLNVLVQSSGAIRTDLSITTPTLTSPKIGTAITDTNGNEIVRTPATSSAVNDVTVTNAATGNDPQISATGDDTNINLKLVGKGTGKVRIPTLYGAITTDTDGSTVTFDCSVTNRHQVTLGGNRTLALSNYSTGQMILLDLIQDGTGSRTVTWFTGPGLTVTMTIAAPGVVTAGQDIPTGTPVVFTTTGALPTGLTAGTTYYWCRVDATTGNVATSLANAQAGTFITTSGSQSGTHTMTCAIRWPSQTAPTLSTGKYVGDTIGIYVKNATAGVFQGYTVGQAM